MPDVTKQRMTAEELRKARKASEQMGDVEFQMDIAPYFDYKAEIDPSIARYRGFKDLPGDVELNLGGFYASPNTEEDPYTREQLKPRVGRVQGVDLEIPTEPGTVNAVHSRATPNIWAHEYRHQMGEDGNGEDFNRLADAAVAQTEGDWESAVMMWRDMLRRKGKDVTPSEAQEDLLGRLKFNQNVTPRKVYRNDYERGARGNVESGPDWWERESANYEDQRIANSLWKRKEKELNDFNWWQYNGLEPGFWNAMGSGLGIIGNSLSERNEERRKK